MLKSRHLSLAENSLIALNAFITFLVLLGNLISIPAWLQPFGRMHPLVLHFPIVLLIISLTLEIFRYRKAFVHEKFYQDFTDLMLLLSALFSALTVIMGLFLSHEDGYSGHVLSWHKWSGVLISFLAALLYFSRHASWFNVRIQRISVAFTFLLLLVAGHFGADLSHGENFVLAPVTKKQASRDLSKALIYDDLLQPALAKCTACHNDDKNKGLLDLGDPDAIAKGGKSGPLYIAGKPELSLILRRIHLPESDKKHMPPSGKPQLTEDEIHLITMWIRDNAPLKGKVSELPPGDSLRQLAANLLKPANEEDNYDFSAADEKTVRSLSTNYRVIYPVSAGSPALVVNLYNRSAYKSRLISELEPIKDKIVSLNLSKMPVSDADLKIISGFNNLRNLNLDFTEITGRGLQSLSGLQHLSRLAISGTKPDRQGFLGLASIKSLSELSAWNTGLPSQTVESFRKARPEIQLLQGFRDDGRLLKLTAPEFKMASLVFKDSLKVDLFNPIKGSLIRYSRGGTAYDSIRSEAYIPGKYLTHDEVLWCRAYKKGWAASDTVQFSVYRSAHRPDSVWLTKTPQQAYTAEGARTLTDQILGNGNLSINWIAYKSQDFEMVCRYDKPATVSSVSFHTLQNADELFVSPAKIEIWGGDRLNSLHLLSTSVPDTARHKKRVIKNITCKFRPARLTYLKLVAVPGSMLYPKPPPKKPAGVKPPVPAAGKDSKDAGKNAAILAKNLDPKAKLAATPPAVVAKPPKPDLVMTKGKILFDEVFFN